MLLRGGRMVTDRSYREQLQHMMRERVIPVLRECELFTELDNEQIQSVAEFAREQEVAEQEFLFRQGQKASDLFVVIEGSLALQVAVPAGTQTVDIVRTHGAAGVSALGIGRRIYSSSALALSRSRLFALDGLKLIHLLDLNPAMAAVIHKAVAVIYHRRYSRFIGAQGPG